MICPGLRCSWHGERSMLAQKPRESIVAGVRISVYSVLAN